LQISNLVFGVEADYDYLGLRGNATSSALYPCCAPTGFTVNSSAHANWLVTARPRLGYAYDNWLFFVSGGFAATNLNAGFSFTDNNSAVSESGSLSKVLTGYAVGGGVEAGLWANWTVKAEYLYVNFGKASISSANLVDPFVGPFPQNVFTHSADLSASLVRLGVNYHF
jgi:outer membrane immunogenic protein